MCPGGSSNRELTALVSSGTNPCRGACGGRAGRSLTYFFVLTAPTPAVNQNQATPQARGCRRPTQTLPRAPRQPFGVPAPMRCGFDHLTSEKRWREDDAIMSSPGTQAKSRDPLTSLLATAPAARPTLCPDSLVSSRFSMHSRCCWVLDPSWCWCCRQETHLHSQARQARWAGSLASGPHCPLGPGPLVTITGAGPGGRGACSEGGALSAGAALAGLPPPGSPGAKEAVLAGFHRPSLLLSPRWGHRGQTASTMSSAVWSHLCLSVSSLGARVSCLTLHPHPHPQLRQTRALNSGPSASLQSV